VKKLFGNDLVVRYSYVTLTTDFTCFTGAPAIPVAVTLLVDVDSYKHNTDRSDIVSIRFHVSKLCLKKFSPNSL